MPPELFSQAPVKRLNLRDIVLGRFLGILVVVFLTTLLPARAVQSVTLAWNASSGAAGYKVYFGTVSGNPGTPIDVSNVTTATISNLNDATTYYFSVSAYNSAGLEGQRSGEIAYTTPSAPTIAYTLTVNGGSGDGPYAAGAPILVTANPAPNGQQFTRWDGDYVVLANRFSSPTSGTMPAQNVAVTAVYSAVPTYPVTVANGSGDNSYPAGATVQITADAPPAGQQFAGWSGNVTFANASSTTTTFVMPANAVAVTANYSVSTGTGTGLRAQYYNDSSDAAYPLANPFTGSPVLTRTETTVDMEVDARSPASQVNSDFFSAKWTGQVKAPVSGTYTFTVTGDDGVRLFLNGVLVIDSWKDQGPSSYSYSTTLTGGTLYNIELQYYEHGGIAVSRLEWSYPGQSRQLIPQSQLFSSGAQAQVAAPGFSPAAGSYSSAQSVTITSATPGALVRYTIDGSNPTASSGTPYTGPVSVSNTTTLKAIAFLTGMTDSSVTSGTYTIAAPPTGQPGTGLRAQYYNDGSNASYPLVNPFTGSPVLTRTDATVDFDWGAGSPGSGLPSNFFSVKWTGQVKAPVSGVYTFTVTGDDGVRLFINGNRVVDAWRDQGATDYTYTTTLAAGTLYSIEVHYYEHEGDAECELRWSYPGQSIRVIPQSQLYPN